MLLGDDFPPELKDQIIVNSITPGQVLKLFCSFTNPPKEKFLLVVSVNPAICIFIINTSIHPFIKSKYDLLESQVLIKKEDYQFLDHDSYIACHEIINHFSMDEIRKQIQLDISRIKEKINANTRNNILIAIDKCRALSKVEKDIVINGLNSMQI
jgi:hypothetical protein